MGRDRVHERSSFEPPLRVGPVDPARSGSVLFGAAGDVERMLVRDELWLNRGEFPRRRSDSRRRPWRGLLFLGDAAAPSRRRDGDCVKLSLVTVLIGERSLISSDGMNNDPLTHGLWEMTAPPAPRTSPLKGEVRADVAIVGCGYTGLSTALRLAEAGAKVVALEAVEIGFGGAGRNVGLVNAGMWLAPNDIVARLGSDYGARLLKLLGDGPSEVEALVTKHGLDCEFVRNGTLHCAIGQSGLAKIEERCAQWRARGAPVKLLNREETARRIGVDIYAGSLLDLRAGTIQPLAYARGLARAALAAGARVHTLSPARAAERTGKAWRLKTDGGSVVADWIVVATDAYAASGPWPQGKREQIRVPYFNFATRPLSDELRAAILPGREGCWDTRMIMNSFRFDQAGRLLFGSIGA